MKRNEDKGATTLEEKTDKGNNIPINGRANFFIVIDY